ncbi:invasion associated locus B family protein [Bradyrhizobium genosp. A]|uniref:invasion associated locus B family protein n=1 Tax=Bradyrhizobium genosp. A TaxID=83626 RepID=UPI003CEFE572
MAAESSLWSTDWLFGTASQAGETEQLAEARQKAPMPAAPAKPTEGTPPQQGAETPAPQPEKTETTNFENWILNCREFVEGPKKRNCAMTVSVRKSDTNRVVLSWTVRPNDKGQFVSVVETLPGISIPPGIQLKLEKSSATKTIPIEVCEPAWCAGSLAMDKAFIQEASASGKVMIVITSSAGQPVQFEFPIKGFEKAYAKM